MACGAHPQYKHLSTTPKHTHSAQTGPFTFDGFGFGYSGLFPGGGFFDGFGVNIYNIIFRDILNEGLNQYLANAITNNPLQPFDFIPPTIGNRFNRDVVSLFGYDAVDK